MPNPNPVQSEAFKAQIKPKHQKYDLADKPICVKFPVDDDEFLRSLDDRAEFIRLAVKDYRQKLASPSTGE